MKTLSLLLLVGLVLFMELVEVRSQTGGCRGPHEAFERCGSHCPMTCANRFAPPRPCPLSCNPGCFCTPGYLRNRRGTCVLPRSCS
ncbi:chymotrypsin inhibitor-like [Discoglossus pictus]